MQFPTFHICDFITRHIFISIINTSQLSITVEPNLKKGKHKLLIYIIILLMATLRPVQTWNKVINVMINNTFQFCRAERRLYTFILDQRFPVLNTAFICEGYPISFHQSKFNLVQITKTKYNTETHQLDLNYILIQEDHVGFYWVLQKMGYDRYN